MSIQIRVPIVKGWSRSASIRQLPISFLDFGHITGP